ncbi:WIAG-tail domain [Paenibacillus sp. GP183]|uniref:WIAG-tail domain n=1 Tax=Paenibacillus sp. GP183 TaxID=1882751 RepID=UPI000B034040|nr:WIAG-tail domain [Paenibacillus sp. GP183]
MKLAAGSVDGSKLATGAVNTDHLADGSIDCSKLAIGSVKSEHLADGTISGNKLIVGSIDGSKLAIGSVYGEHLALGSISGSKLTEGSVDESKLSFQTIQLPASRSNTVQQFGLASFEFKVQDEFVDVQIYFDDAFADLNYVLIATTNHTACYAVVKQKSTNYAILSVVRTRFSAEIYGIINWIAMGTKA